MTAVLGGPAVACWGLLFTFVPVALNSYILVATGFLFHKLLKRPYSPVALPRAVNTHLTEDPLSSKRSGLLPADIDAALAALDETFDKDRNDLTNLLQQVEIQAAIRHIGPVACRDIMSRDVIVARNLGWLDGSQSDQEVGATTHRRS